MRGRAEHAGNRNYFGQERIDAASKHRVHQQLRRIAHLRESSPALQRGLQLNERLKGDLAVFYRVYQKGDTSQTALVMLNKGNQTTRISVSDYLEPGEWRDAFTGDKQHVRDRMEVDVPVHGGRVFMLDQPLTREDTRKRLAEPSTSTISLAVPAFAQQKDTVDIQIIEQLAALDQKYDEAFNNGDGVALAATYTEDAVLVTDTGPVYGRKAIEKHYADPTPRASRTAHASPVH